ncbi:MAG: hypothetical protein ACLFUI_02850 [Halanaerobiales bacterium]
MKKTILAFLFLAIIFSINTFAFELVEAEVEDNTVASLGLEYGYIYRFDEYDHYDSFLEYVGVTGGARMSDNVHIKLLLGRINNVISTESDFIIMAKPMYYFKRDINRKLYGFGMVSGFLDEVSVGIGFGYQREFGFTEFAISNDYFCGSGGVNIEF